jgi:hypothetical protein
MNRRRTRRALSLLLTLAMTVLLFSAMTLSASATTYYGSATGIVGGDIIAGAGTYTLAGNATGTIYINTTDDVTIVGNGAGTPSNPGTPNEELTIDCSATSGVNLTIQDLYIKNVGENGEVGINAIDFTGTDNTLTLAGTNMIEGMEYTQKAVIHAGTYVENEITLFTGLTINGSGTLYLYKYTQGAGIGGNANEANGNITFASGNTFIKGSKTGPLVGNDLCTGTVSVGNISITGGNLCLINKAQGAGIGGSRLSGAGAVGISGGNVTFITDFSGSAVGAGAQVKGTASNNGTLTITGGSVKAMIMDNAYSSWSNPSTTYERVVPATGETYVVDNAAIKQAIINAGDNVAPVVFDTADLPAATTYSVEFNDNLFYEGGLHNYQYSDCTFFSSHTMENWDKVADSQLYFYLPKLSTVGDTHTLTVNGVNFTCRWNGSGFDAPVAVNSVDLGGSGYSTFSSAKTALGTTTPGVIYVIGKVTVSNDETWDLDGQVLARGSSYNGDFVEVTGGTLTLEDIGLNGKIGAMTPSSSIGSLVSVGSSGTLDVGGGAILQNNCTSAIATSGTVNLNSGSILRGNGGYTACTTLNGAGVNVSGGTLSVADGATLEKNFAIANGGAICVGSGSATVNGTLSHNGAVYGGGVAVMDEGDLTVSSAGVITYNKATTNGGGVYLAGTATYDIDFSATIAGNMPDQIYP